MAYADATELARLLKLKESDFSDQLARVLDTAALEIDRELGRTVKLADDMDATDEELALAAEVNLERAVEHWQQGYSPFGIIGLGAESGPAFASSDSWNRHAFKLAPLKESWGLA